jgi:hypothetical protein
VRNSLVVTGLRSQSRRGRVADAFYRSIGLSRSTTRTQSTPFPVAGIRASGERYVGAVSDVVRIELGVSILQGELIAQDAKAAGLRVQLLRNEHPETGAAFALGTCALLVAAEHEAEVRELLAEHGY